MRSTKLVALMCTVVLAGCGSPSTQLIGVPPTLQQSNLVADQQLQNQMVGALIEKADLSRELLLEKPERWREVTYAGLVEVDIQCDRYLAALFSFNREQRAGRQVLTAAGAGTAAILGLTGAAGATVALVAAAFGIAANVFDAGANSVLFAVSPTAVRAVAVRGRQAFLETIKWEQVNSRPRMMMVVQGYLAQCTPAAIEANIDNAATGAPSVSNIGTALKAAALASPSSSVVQDSAVFMASPVSGPTHTPPDIPTPNRPLNVTKAESVFIQTKADAEALQSALGTTPDGNLGPAGLATPGPTRLAISEFHAGLLRQADRNSKARGSDVMDGDRDNYLFLRTGGPLPPILHSAFERGLLTDRPNCVAISPILTALKKPLSSTEVTSAQCMDLMRAAILARRGEPGAPPAVGKSDALDSKLFDKLQFRDIADPPEGK